MTKMAEMVRVRSAEEYFKEYGLNGIGKGADKWMIRRQLIDAFQKEMCAVVVARDVEGRGKSVAVYRPDLVHSAGDRARRIFAVADVLQEAGCLDASRRAL